MSSPALEQVGSYRLLRLLATGGMGEVYLARQEGPAGFARTVVVKRLLRHLARDETFVRMFLNEARLAALIAHPNVVQVYELGRHQESYFLAMEYVPGASVKQILAGLRKRHTLPSIAVSVFLIAEALKGLEQAHQTKDMEGRPLHIVHRDVSPDNLLVSNEGAVKVVDFGIAKARALASGTVTHTIKGKFAYMAPEQLCAQPVDARTDVYGIGVVLYELLTGRRPFEAESEPALIHAAMTDLPEPPSLLRPEVSAELEAVVLRSLQKTPEARYASAAEMGQALQGLLPENDRPAAAHALGALAAGVGPAVASTMATVSVPGGNAKNSLAPRPRRRWTAGVGVTGALVALGFWGARFLPPQKPPIVRPVETSTTAPTPPALPPVPPSDSRPDPADPVPQPRVRSTSESPRRRKATAQRPVEQPPLAPGRVTFRVHPWSEVFWNGRALGTTPLPPVTLPAGKQTLILKNPELGQERQVTVDVPASGEVTVRVNLFDAPPKN